MKLLGGEILYGNITQYVIYYTVGCVDIDGKKRKRILIFPGLLKEIDFSVFLKMDYTLRISKIFKYLSFTIYVKKKIISYTVINR